jgi:predicted dehydrogenase
MDELWTNGRVMAASSTTPIGVAVIGYGYWGPNLARNVSERSDLDLAMLCEPDAARAAAFAQRHPDVPVAADLDTALADPRVEAVIVATPPRTHASLVEDALRAGRHVLVEKPLATSGADARRLVELADREGLILMPGHTFVYSPAVNAVKQLIDDEVLGEIYFITSSRMNLGKYQRDGVVCDLAPHDLSILLYWLGEPISQVAASARSVFVDDVPETAFLTLTFAGGTTANVQVSWLAPRKVRSMVIVGSRRMVAYDDTASDEPIRVYDRGMDLTTPANFGEYQLTYRTGDIVSPRIDALEPLSLELADFARSVRSGHTPRSNAQLGLEIVEALEAAEHSLRNGGMPVALGMDERLAA